MRETRKSSEKHTYAEEQKGKHTRRHRKLNNKLVQEKKRYIGNFAEEKKEDISKETTDDRDANKGEGNKYKLATENTEDEKEQGN